MVEAIIMVLLCYLMTGEECYRHEQPENDETECMPKGQNIIDIDLKGLLDNRR